MSGKKQKKQVVLMIAKNFLAYHKRAGQATEFEAKIKDKDKVHTIRPNYEKWKEKNRRSEVGKSGTCIEAMGRTTISFNAEQTFYL